tara:strand:- start:95 stop:319 length:225 start_codon:yes stop_codon:yes gene_type:complete
VLLIFFVVFLEGMVMSESTGGKGDRRRKENGKKFRQNYAEIFKKFDFVEAVRSIKNGKQKNSHVDDRPKRKKND